MESKKTSYVIIALVLAVVLMGLYIFFQGDQSEYKKKQSLLEIEINVWKEAYGSAQDSISLLTDSLEIVSDSLSVRQERIIKREVKYVYVKSDKQRAYSSLDTAGHDDKLRLIIATADSIRALSPR